MKLLLSFFILAILGLNSTQLAIAAKKPVMQVDPQHVAVQVQNFPVTEPTSVDIQLRYVDHKIKQLALHNNSEKSLKITLFEVAYELRANEELSLNVPDVKHIVVQITQYDPNISNTTKNLQPSKAYLFRQQANGVFELYSTY